MIYFILLGFSSLLIANPVGIDSSAEQFVTCVQSLKEEVRSFQSVPWKWMGSFDQKFSETLLKVNAFSEISDWVKEKENSQTFKTQYEFLLGNGLISCQEITGVIQIQRDRYQKYLILMILGTFTVLIVLWGRTKENFRNKKEMILIFLFALPVRADTLNVYTYDALTGKGSFGEILSEQFKKKTGSELKIIPFGSEGEALNQIVIEGKNTKADILLGIDNGFASRAKETGLFTQIDAKYFLPLEKNILLDRERMFLPFDYGYLAFLYNEESVQNHFDFKHPTLRSFLKNIQLHKKIVIADPRTSSLGYSFLLWTKSVSAGKEDLQKLWNEFFPKLITLSPSWSGAYGMFLKGEVDWVLSYTTSRAYHLEKEKQKKYQVLVFEDGHAIQVEGVAQVKASKKTKLIDEFLKLILSEEVQEKLPTSQWMYPARTGTKLPISFKSLPVPKPIKSEVELTEDERKLLIKDWTRWGANSP